MLKLTGILQLSKCEHYTSEHTELNMDSMYYLNTSVLLKHKKHPKSAIWEIVAIRLAKKERYNAEWE